MSHASIGKQNHSKIAKPPRNELVVTFIAFHNDGGVIQFLDDRRNAILEKGVLF